jgi:hypothetical protein
MQENRTAGRMVEYPFTAFVTQDKKGEGKAIFRNCVGWSKELV